VRCYKCQLDEQWFDLTKDTLRDSLQITPINNNQAFTFPPSSNALINFVNDGIPESDQELVQYKRNLAQYTHRKKKATLIVIPSIRFTKLIIYHLQRKHKFHPRPYSPLHLPDEEPVLGYLKFSAKGTKREVFGMPIPGSFITADIQGSDPDCPAPKPTKTAKKSKPTAPKADLRLPVSKPASSKQPEPKPAPTKTQGKKCKLVTDISDKPSSAKKSKLGLVTKRRKPASSLRPIDESVAEDIPYKEPRVDDEEADVHRALEESLKSMYDVPRGPLSPVVIREPESGKYQPLLEVPGKGKETVTEEQVSRDLLTLQTPKKKSPADRYIFQRRTSAPTGSFGHDESSSLYAELGLTDSDEESDEDVPGTDAGIQAKGQAGPDPGDAEASQPLPSPIVYAGSDLEHMDLDVQENLKLTVEEHVILEEPASSSGTLSSLQHLTKYLSFGDLFFSDKSSKADNDKATTKTEAGSMVSITIQQDTSLIPPMTTLIIDLTSRPESPKVHQLLKETATKTKTTTTTTTTTHPPPSQQHQRTTDSMMMKRIGPSRASGSLGASRSSQVLPPPPPPLSTNQEDLQMDDDMAPDAQAQSSDDEDIGNAIFPRHNVSKPLPLGGLPGQVTIQSDFFFNKDLEYLRYDSKGSRPALSISKMKAAYYPDVGLEQMVTDQMSLEPPTTQRQEDSYYCRQLIDQTFGYPKTSRILPGRMWIKAKSLCSSEMVKDKEDLLESGKLCWWTSQRWRLQTSEAYE
nr:hypothetical protein [Tanacetum cinerariifolium]